MTWYGTAPTFNADGSAEDSGVRHGLLFNGVLVQNRFQLKGQTLYIGQPFYKAYDRRAHQAPGAR